MEQWNVQSRRTDHMELQLSVHYVASPVTVSGPAMKGIEGEEQLQSHKIPGQNTPNSCKTWVLLLFNDTW